jgi:hypothetical protein
MNEQKHCWYNLKIDTTNCFLEGYKLPKTNGELGIWSLHAKDIFKPQWLEYVESIGVFITSAMIFYRGPGTGITHAHIDISDVEPLSLSTFGINWCYGGKNSEMVWYETPIEPKQLSYTPAKTPYMSWNINELKEIERTHIGNEVSIVRTNIPHGIKMDTDPRWTISARYSELEGAKWETIIEELRDRNLLIER